MDLLSLLPCSSVPRAEVNDVALLSQKSDEFISNARIGAWIYGKNMGGKWQIIISIQTSDKDDS